MNRIRTGLMRVVPGAELYGDDVLATRQTSQSHAADIRGYRFSTAFENRR